MPTSLELEEFGLEVEREHEHHSLVDSGASAGGGAARRSNNAHSLSLYAPSKEQRSLLQSSNARPSRLLRPGVLKWAVIVLALAVVVFVHLGQERDETAVVEAQLPGVEACEDDDREFSVMVGSERDCAAYVAAREGGEGSFESACDEPIRIPDEDEFQKLLKHFCRRSCGLCGTEDAVGETSEAVIEAEVGEIAEEIEEKEMKEQIENEMEEQALEEQVEQVEQVEQEMEKEEGEEIAPTDGEEGGENDEREDDHSAEDTGIENESLAEGEETNQSIASNGSKTYHSIDEEQSDASVNEGGIDVVNDSDPENDLAEIGTDESTEAVDKEEGTDVVDVVDDSDSANVEPDKSTEAEANEEPATTSQENGDFGTFTLQRLQDTRTAAQNLIDTLEQYYNGAPQANNMMLNAWLSPWNYDEPDGAAREGADKLVDTMARALVTDDQEEFLIGVIGSSVAAGHDNCRYDSYESQLERTFGPIWEAAGMRLVCQNAGQGGGCGDDFQNQAYCVKQNVSPNVDIAHYTWTYFEEGHNDKYALRESLIRWTQMLPRQPPVHVLNTLYRPDVIRGTKEYELAERYAAYGYNAFYMRTGHENGFHDYAADEKNGVDRYAWGSVGDGYHDVTRYGRDEEDPGRRGSLGVVMRNWHPGPLAFEFVSDTFAYVYSKAVLAALDLIEARMTAAQDPRELWSASGRDVLLKGSLPEPKYCDPAYCVVDEAPGCLNFELPTFGSRGATIEDPDGGLNPHRGELQNWKVWHEENDIWHAVGKPDTAFFQNRDDKGICAHPDRCGGVSASSPADGAVVFRLPKMEVGLVAICGCCGKEVAEEMFLRNDFLEIKYNGAVLNRTEWDVFPTGKCARLLRAFPTGGAASLTPTGHAYLSVRALEGLSEPVRISHVITL